ASVIILIFIVLILVVALFMLFNRQVSLLNELRLRSELGDKGQGELKQTLEKTYQNLENLRTIYEERKKTEDESREMVKRLERTISGTYSKGLAGENILRESFKIFPREMMINDFVVNGKRVEFALVLPDKKVLPIDSKWPATELLTELNEETDDKRRASLINQIEKEVSSRAKEVCKYIDPSLTTPWAIATIPDAAFSVCKKAIWESYNNKIFLMPYSQTVPYILTFYSLYRNYTKQIDLKNLQERLVDLDRQLSSLEEILENKLSRGSIMVSNAYVECKELVGRLKTTSAYLQAVKDKKRPAIDKENGIE
ncbi:MAG: DNA recombination protein RmuC, partial [Candidatus Subteraquimicrobiales bacterium]|nr:DNA recombination protein RmuC [Candidatus Subteraquimicrobiales bacterium]